MSNLGAESFAWPNDPQNAEVQYQRCEECGNMFDVDELEEGVCVECDPEEKFHHDVTPEENESLNEWIAGEVERSHALREAKKAQMKRRAI